MFTSSAVRNKRFALYLLIALAGFALDIGSKHWIFARLGFPGLGGERIEIVGETLCLETSVNEGALFGIGQGQRWIFVSFSLVAVVGICVWLFCLGAAHDLLLTIALGMITGGILGNLWDRVGLPQLRWPYGPRTGETVYAVRDWIHFQIPDVFDWPVFNIADSLLVVGVGFLLWQTLTAPAEASPATDPAAGPR